MADTSKTEIPHEVRSFAEQSFEQARQAFDSFFSATQRAVSNFEDHAAAVQAGARELQHKVTGYTQRNIAASFEFTRKLLQAKSAEEVARLHADYVKAQIEVMTEQARELGRTAAANATKDKH